MTRKQLLLLFLCFILFVINSYSQKDENSIDFIINRGQWRNEVKFMAKIGGGEIWLEKNSFTFNFANQEEYELLLSNHHKRNRELEKNIIHKHAFTLQFDGSNSNPTISVSGKSNFYHNYYLGNDESKWASNVPIYKEIIYSNLYDGIDLNVSTSKDGYLKYDYIIHPNGNSNQLKWKFVGVNSILSNNKTILNSSVGEIVELIPEVYQIIGNKKVIVEFELKKIDQFYCIHFPNGYNLEYDLIIDPTLVFSTYTGSVSDNWGYCSAYDSYGNSYAGGVCIGPNFPVSLGAYDVTYAGGNIHTCDIAIIKYSSDGMNRMYATFLGGSESEIPHSMIVDSQENLIIYGTTSSTNFPTTTGCFDVSFGGGNYINVSNWFDYLLGSDIFISKINENGNILLASTFIGGSENDGLNLSSDLYHNYGDDVRGEVIIDNNDNILVTSTTLSNNFPTTPGVLSNSLNGTQDGVAFKLNSNLTSLIWSTYLGGNLDDTGYGLKINPINNNIYVCGGTNSNNFPTTNNSLQNQYQGGIDGYVIELNSNSASMIEGSYLGTNSYDQAYMIQTDSDGDVYVLGQTSGNYQVLGNVYSNQNAPQFIHKMNANLDSTVWSTVFGKSNNYKVNIAPTAFLVDDCKKIYVAGWGGQENSGFAGGNTFNLPVTIDALDSTTDGSDFYLIMLGANAEYLEYATYLGNISTQLFTLEEHTDGGMSRFDNNGTIYLAVCGSCGNPSNFPTTPGAWSTTNNSSKCNMILVKMEMRKSEISPPTYYLDSLCNKFYFYGSNDATNHFWNFNDSSSYSFESNPEHIFLLTGNYSVIYVSNDSINCIYNDTTYININVSNSNNIIDDVLIPNVFSPNGDNINEEFRIGYANYPSLDAMQYLEDYHVQIYNRWGKLVFEGNVPWNGKMNNSGDQLSEGVYYYILRYQRTCLDTKPTETHGYVSLLRN